MSQKNWILIHGAGGGGWEWRIWQRVLQARGQSWVAPNLQPAQAGLAATRLEDYCAQVDSLPSCTANSGPILVGASMGAVIALQVAAGISPTALILVNPVPPAGVADKWLGEITSEAIKPWSELAFERTVAALPDADSATWQFAHRRWRDESGLVLNQLARGVDVSPPSVPCLVICSENDQDISPQIGRSVARWANAQWVTLAGASHLGGLLGYAAGPAANLACDWVNTLDGVNLDPPD